MAPPPPMESPRQIRLRYYQDGKPFTFSVPDSPGLRSESRRNLTRALQAAQDSHQRQKSQPTTMSTPSHLLGVSPGRMEYVKRITLESGRAAREEAAQMISRGTTSVRTLPEYDDTTQWFCGQCKEGPWTLAIVPRCLGLDCQHDFCNYCCKVYNPFGSE